MAFNLTPASILSNLASGLSLLGSVARLDVVAILDQESLQQIASGARPVKAAVRETARVMDYPVETGAILSDHKISNPTEVELICIIPQEEYQTAYQEIRNAWVNATLLSIQTRTGTYRNMIISDMPHEEDPEMFTAVTQAIRFREIIFFAPNSIAPPGALANYSPRNPVQQSIVNRGLLSPSTAVGAALSYFRAASILGA